ncbi:hypothetical protein [Maribacter sp. Asnod1-A12]|uniref:hypothetical protein n=1 Tax=Maribacter sp. Asnod1-A12 TaxID=3160576 RepID=UPI00386AEE5C
MRLFCYLFFFSLALTAQNYHYAVDNKATQETEFYLEEKARTSAGVYNGDVLLRTLWSNVEKDKGIHTIEWDGLDDEGIPVSSGNYTIKVLSNNVEYEWLSPIGNTSNTEGGTAILKHLEVIQGMVQVGDFIYYNFGFNEHDPAFSKIHVDSVNVNLATILQNIHYGLEVKYMATDGTSIYISGSDLWSTGQPSMIFAINVSTENQVDFTAGEEYTLASNHKYTSAFGLMDDGGNTSEITGMAIVANYLYVARGELNQIYVYNKITGGLERTIDHFVHPKELTADANNLWVISETNTIEKYNLNANGSINSLSTIITGVEEPLAIAIKSDGEIAITDNGTQQIKIFNSSGTLIETFGQLNGYASSPDVADDKFMFVNPSEPQMGTFLFYQDDGKLWVGDTGNYRSLRFNTNKTLDDTIMYLCFIRSMGVDRNDVNRVFANYLEFNVEIASGNWSYLKNWSYNINDDQDSEFHRLKWVTTLSNGKTYAIQPAFTSGYWEVVELTATGIRFTGKLIDNSNSAVLTEDWSIRTFNDIIGQSETGPAYWKDQPLLGFDASDNPEWGASTLIGSTGLITSDDPTYRATVGWNFPPRADTSSNLLISFEGGITDESLSSSKYHLGATPKSGEGFVWKTAEGTDRNYTGDYPNNGMYDMGNGVNYPGGIILVKEKSIFWNYHGEFWKNGQTNKFQHVYDNGLLLGVFGVAGNELYEGKAIQNQIGVPQMAGNNIKGDIVKIGEDYYILHGDEGKHGAVHRWKIGGLNSIKEHNINIQYKE